MEVFSEEELGQESRGKSKAWKLALWAGEVSYPAGRESAGSILSHTLVQGASVLLNTGAAATSVGMDPYVYSIFV